jgi:hypothetical protein
MQQLTVTSLVDVRVLKSKVMIRLEVPLEST